MRVLPGLGAILLVAAATGLLLPACDDEQSEEAGAGLTDGDEDEPSTDDGGRSGAGARADGSIPNDSSTRADASVPTDTNTRSDASTGAVVQGTFDGTILAAAMSGTVGGGKGPFWLYNGGVSPTDEEGLLPIPAEALKHRAANPDLWIPWRRAADGTVERSIEGKWKPLAYDDEYAALPKGSSFAGTFESAATVADIAGRIRKYRFAKSGSYEFCELFVAGSSISEERASGTYQVDGYVIKLVSKSGTQETFSLVYDPSQRPNTMWIDRGMFTRDNGASATEPLDC
jgi:hypothetical protein